MGDALKDAVARVVEPLVAAHGADLEEVDTRKAGRRTVLVVTVDADGGINLDTVAELAKEISDALDESGVMGQLSYTLEVGSPGVGRPLTLPRHWRRNVGRLAQVRLIDGPDLEGRIADAGETSATLTVGSRSTEVSYADVARAVIVVEFPKDGS